MPSNQILQIITTRKDFLDLLNTALENRPTYVMPPELLEIEMLKARPALSPKEVAKLYDIAEGTLANWRMAGKGPAFCQDEDNGKITYRAEDLENYFLGIRRVTYA